MCMSSIQLCEAVCKGNLDLLYPEEANDSSFVPDPAFRVSSLFSHEFPLHHFPLHHIPTGSLHPQRPLGSAASTLSTLTALQALGYHHRSPELPLRWCYILLMARAEKASGSSCGHETANC